MTILALRPGALGDTVLTLPALRALRARFPGTGLHLVGHPGAAALLCEAGEIDAFTDFDAPVVAGLFSRTGVVDPFEQLQPIQAAIAWLADPEGLVEARLWRLGAQRVLVTPSRPEPQRPRHLADHLLATLAPWGVVAPPPRSLVLAGHTARAASASAPVIIHPGSGSAAKNWPPESFAQAASALHRAHGLRVALLCGPADEAACAAALRASGDLPIVQPATVLEMAHVLAQARAYVGNDSGVSHVAAALGVPTVALFGPTDLRLWAPRGFRVRVLPFAAPPREVADAVVGMLPPRDKA